MINNLAQAIKQAALKLTNKDDGAIPTAQVVYNERPAEIQIVYPYGLCANAPKGSLVLLFNVQGQEENRAGIANHVQSRFKNLKEGEVAVGNYMTECYVKFNEDGDTITVVKRDSEVTIDRDLNVTILGNATVTVGGVATLTCPEINLVGQVNLGETVGPAIARVGDEVEVVIDHGSSSGTYIGTIITGGNNTSD